MIKVFKVKCIKDLSYEKTQFNTGRLYLAYATDSRMTVVSGNDRKGFCDIEKCMFKHGHPYGFQKFFEVVDTFYAQNKKELKKLIKDNSQLSEDVQYD